VTHHQLRCMLLQRLALTPLLRRRCCPRSLRRFANNAAMATVDAPLEIFQFGCLSDNYSFLLHCRETGATAVVDTPEYAAIDAALQSKQWKLTHILNTHHHHDHTGANLQLKEKYGCTVVGAAKDAERIPGIDVRLSDGDVFSFGNAKASVIETHGHTVGHISYYFPASKAAFVGDTLFALGCGRLFEGSPAMMWASMEKLLALPDDTAVYCAHEYTLQNAKFAVTVEPDNAALQARVAEIQAMRAQSKPTVPTTIGLEKATNPFCRPSSLSLQKTVGVSAPLDAVFGEVRRRKDAF